MKLCKLIGMVLFLALLVSILIANRQSADLRKDLNALEKRVRLMERIEAHKIKERELETLKDYARQLEALEASLKNIKE